MTEYFLGGSLSPIGLSVSFLREPVDVVRRALLTWRKRELSQTIEEHGPIPFPRCALLLDPLEAPWTMELLIGCGEWTCYVNNSIGGGDPSAAAPYLSTRLQCDCVVAMHAPPYGPGHAATQLWLLGPRGRPPLMYVRTIAAHAEDGRWSWSANGPVQAFETPGRYRARRIKDRFDRPVLAEYLGAIGIRVDDLSFYGEGVGIHQVVRFSRRRESAKKVRASFGW